MLNMNRYCKIQDKIADYITTNYGLSVRIVFSAYKEDENGAIDNLDEVPIEGKVIFIREKSSFVEIPFLSSIYTSPTWLEICDCANDSIILTGDNHHVFLEDVSVDHEENGIKIAKLIMGS